MPSRPPTTTSPSLEEPPSVLLSCPTTEMTITFKAGSSPAQAQLRQVTPRPDGSVRHSDSSYTVSQTTTATAARTSSSVSSR
ncbi:unnamed protein product [Dibothriocephalus latus]|uniref:Uncharacterized protein n=1 Tax=Dibothriocephalus latus TaxID=60516 RepID=A0A3P7N5J4_DIBLA|nr:unnamed protein product [Dibothriocephalus latus]